MSKCGYVKFETLGTVLFFGVTLFTRTFSCFLIRFIVIFIIIIISVVFVVV